MIPAHKFPPGQLLVWHLIHSSLRKHFDRVFLRVCDEVLAGQQSLPIIACANHASWWDGYLAALVERQTGRDTYLMMEEAQLKRYFFFRWAGCFSVDRQDGRSAMQSLRYAAKLLKERPGRQVWLFPQGEIAPNDRRPLVFYSGAAHLARMAAPVLLCPVASRIEYLAEQRPDVFISLGKPIMVDGEQAQERGFLKACTSRLEALVTAELDRLRDDVIASNYSDFTRVMQGKASTNRIFDALLLRKQIRRQ